jgi:hypothetical protein
VHKWLNCTVKKSETRKIWFYKFFAAAAFEIVNTVENNLDYFGLFCNIWMTLQLLRLFSPFFQLFNLNFFFQLFNLEKIFPFLDYLGPRPLLDVVSRIVSGLRGLVKEAQRPPFTSLL